jgi:predicted ATPase/GAF domain-containing protein
VSQLVIKESRVLKRDSFFQLQRVTTREGESLLVKVAVSDMGNEETLLEREFERFKALGSVHSLKPLRLERVQGKLGAYYEDVDGDLLVESRHTPPPGSTGFSDVARGLCSVLADFHRKQMILVGITPRSFLRRSTDAELVLTDAPLAQTAGESIERGRALWLASPYLPYAAPEVLVRSAHVLDHRADLYALGVVLHELLCGRRPFDSEDPAELIQCHLAKAPPSILQHHPSYSRGLSDLLLSLLAKNPVDRYDRLDAVEEALARELEPTSERRSALPSSRSQAAPALSFSDTPHGRDGEIRVLRDAVRKARSSPGLLLVRGEAGAGKTSLLHHVLQEETQVVSCRGRFNQSGPVAPLSGWAGALRDLANGILTRPVADAESWRLRVLDALGDGAPLLGALVHEWKAVLRCEAPENASLDPVLGRLALSIHRLFRCYSDADLPLVLMLDDLQWADPSSLKILELVLALPDPVGLLVLAGVRTSDGSESLGALRSLEQALGRGTVEVETLTLASWNRHDLQGFLEKSFADGLEAQDEFVSAVLTRTDGNPFFVRELLKTLVEKGAIRFDSAVRKWSWSETGLRELAPAESIVGLLSAKIQDLPDDTKEVLRFAACLGPTFRFDDLEAVLVRRAAIGRSLESAVQAGMLVVRDRVGDGTTVSYDFAHDRVLEASRALASPDERRVLSLHIGRTLSARRADPASEDRFYRLAGYFNAAGGAVEGAADCYGAAELNVRAGQLAKARGAFSQALDYLKAGLGFFDRAATESAGARDPWRERRALAVSLHEEAAEAALLNGELELMERLCQVVLDHVDTPLAKVFAYDVKIRGFDRAKNFAAAADCALEILGALDVEFPRRPGVLHAVVGFLATKRRIFARPVSELLERPRLEDRTILAASSVINRAYSPIYLGRPNLFPLFVLKQVNDALRYGHDDYSAIAYSAFALVLAGMGDIDRAVALSEMALELSSRLQSDRLKAKLFMCHYTFVAPWRHPLKGVLPYYQDGLKAGLEHGDFEYACFLMTLHSLARLHLGVPLEEVGRECENHLTKITMLGQERSILLQALLSQIVLDLRTPTNRAPLSGPIYDEAKALPRCSDPVDHNLIIHDHLAKLMLAFLLGDRAAALEAVRLGRDHLATGAFGHYMTAIFLFYQALAVLSLSGARPSRRDIRTIRRNQRQMRKWADAAPTNFLHKYHLVEAEVCRVRGRLDRAAEHFERAIELGQTHGYPHEAAMAQERAAAFYLERGMNRLGRQYLQDAYLAYRRWGATAVTARLEAEYPQHFALMVAGAEVGGASAPARFPVDLDYLTLLKSSQAISGEMLLPRLVELLLKTMMEHAGAQRGLLLLERRGRLSVVAESDVDRGTVTLHEEEATEDMDRLSSAVVHYAARTETPVVLDDALREGMFRSDPYVVTRKPRSVLCVPILYQGRVLGVAYLENNRMSHVFTSVRLEIVKLLAGQAAISIANARFHALQLEAQQAKINPHFLFNALSSIAELAVTNGPDAEEAILRLAKLYRYILETSNQALVPLTTELEIVRTYLSLEQLRHPSHLAFSVTHEGEVERVTLPGLLIQPLVENCIKHGISPALRKGHVWVHAVTSEDTCTLVIQDDGDGTKASSPGAGFGLRSVQERLALVYGQRYSFAVTQRGGYRVEIEIPVTPSSGLEAHQSIENS